VKVLEGVERDIAVCLPNIGDASWPVADRSVAAVCRRES